MPLIPSSDLGGKVQNSFQNWHKCLWELGEEQRLGGDRLEFQVWDIPPPHAAPHPTQGRNSGGGAGNLQREGEPGDPLTEGPRPHGTAAAEKTQWCGESRQRQELRQWPQGQYMVAQGVEAGGGQPRVESLMGMGGSFGGISGQNGTALGGGV